MDTFEHHQKVCEHSPGSLESHTRLKNVLSAAVSISLIRNKRVFLLDESEWYEIRTNMHKYPFRASRLNLRHRYATLFFSFPITVRGGEESTKVLRSGQDARDITEVLQVPDVHARRSSWVETLQHLLSLWVRNTGAPTRGICYYRECGEVLQLGIES